MSLYIFLIAGCVSSPNLVEDDTVEEPFYAWDFTLQSLDGISYTLSDLHGQWVLVNFWATWCAPCLEEMPALQEIHDDFDNVIVLGINQRENPREIQPFVEELSINFPILINPPDRLLLDYAVVGLPQSILVNPDGIIVWRQFGPVDVDDLGQEILSQINGF